MELSLDSRRKVLEFLVLNPNELGEFLIDELDRQFGRCLNVSGTTCTADLNFNAKLRFRRLVVVSLLD